MKRYLSFASVLALISLLNSKATAQTTYDWTGASNGAWLTTTNWSSTSPGTYPGVSGAAGAGNANDVARFTNASTAVGIDMAAATGQLSLGAIDFNSLTSLIIGNSAASAGILQLNGATVNAVANTLISVGSAGGNLTITNAAAGGSSTMELRLGITNGVFNVYGDAIPGGTRTLSINTVISEANAGSGFTVQGGGSVLLSQANTFTGDVTINNGRVQISNNTALGAGAGKTIVNSGGTLFLNTALTVNENIDFAGNGFTETATLFGAIRIGNVATTLNGALTMTGNALFFVQGNTTTVNGGLAETGGARNLALAGAGTLALASAGSYTGTTTLSQTTLNVTGDNGAINGTSGITVNGAGTFRITNTTGSGNVGTRIADATNFTLNNGNFQFIHTGAAATSYSETVGNLTISGHANIVAASQAVAGQASALTFNTLSRTTADRGGVIFTGLGLGANTQNQILFTAAPTLVGGATQATGGIIGGWAVHVQDTTSNATIAATLGFASYGANGVMTMGNINTSTDTSTWTALQNIRLTMAGTTIASPGGAAATNINSFTAILTGGTNAAFDNVVANPATLRIGSGGILVQSNSATNFAMNFAASTTLTSVTGELLFNIGANSTVFQTGPLVNDGGTSVGITKLGAGTLVLVTDQLNLTGPLVVSGSGAVSTVRLDNSDGLGGISSVTLKATNGGDGAVLNINAGQLNNITQPLNMSANLTGGVSNARFVANNGLNARSALITNQGFTWSGNVTVSGNHFIQFYQNTAGAILNMTGTVTSVGLPTDFTGMILARGNATGIVRFTNTINLPQGTLAVTGSILELPDAATTVFGLNAQNGIIRLGGNNRLPVGVVAYMGQNGSATNVGQLWLNGRSQTFAEIGIQTGSTAPIANQIIQNGNNPNSTLTFAGNANPSTFAGTIRDDDPAAATTGILGITQTTGNLTLSGANTYTGVTALNGGQLSIPSISNATVAGPLGSAAVAPTNLVINGGTLNYTGASGSTDRGFTAGASGATFNVTTAASNLTFSGNSVMTGALNKVGPGILTLSGANTGAGATNVNAGTLALNNTTGAATGTGLTTVASGATIRGNGTVGGSLTIGSGATLSPGNSVGQLNANAGTTEWGGGGRYLLEYDHTGGVFTPGTTIDLYNSAGSLNLSATTGTPFLIDLRFLGNPNTALQTPTNVRIATFTGGGFGTYTNAAQFAFAGDFVGASPTIDVIGNDLVLNFTPVPEPATVGLFAAAIAGFAVRRMRKRAA